MVLPKCNSERPKTPNQWGLGVENVVLRIKTEISIRKELNVLWLEGCIRLVTTPG